MNLQDKVSILAKLTTRNERGHHFTSTYSESDIQALESEGLIEINKPVHAATGIPYGIESWTVEVSEDGLALVEANPEYIEAE